MDTRRLFVTGFGAFADVTFNPSGAIASALRAEPPGGWAVTSVVLPVTFAGAPQAIDVAFAGLSVVPDLLLGIGVHRGHTFRLERRARAQASCDVRPDSDGSTRYAADGHDRFDHATSIDLHANAVALSKAGAGAVTVSNDAGQYVCERAYHHLLARAQDLGVRALFLHVPPEPALSHVQQSVIVRTWLSRFDTL